MSDTSTLFRVLLLIGLLGAGLQLGLGDYIGLSGIDTNVQPVNQSKYSLQNVQDSSNVTVESDRVYLTEGEAVGYVQYDVSQTNYTTLQFQNLSWYGSQGNSITLDGSRTDASGNFITVSPTTEMNATGKDRLRVYWDTNEFLSQAGNTELVQITFGEPRTPPYEFVISTLWNILTLQSENPIITAVLVYPVVITVAFILGRAIVNGLPFT